MILWGPPGCGKTTLARLIAAKTRSEFVPFSAVMSGIKEIKQVMAAAEGARRYGRRTVVFVDEIHRFNKAQQDAFLPYVEAGTILLIGATTENPSFEVIAPLLSRMKVYVLHALSSRANPSRCSAARSPIKRRGLGNEHSRNLRRSPRPHRANRKRRRARRLQHARSTRPRHRSPIPTGRRIVTRERLEDVLQHKLLLYDKAGEEHFNLISALHKSVRNSDPDASLYWLARMLESGEDPLYLARRMVRMASEDIGLADPNALQVTLAAMNAFDFLGVPEGHLALAEAAVYLSLAPKSNAVYAAYNSVRDDLQQTIAEPVPLHLRNAVTGLMGHLGYGKGYQYAHNTEEKVTNMTCLPDSLQGRVYYHPTDQGLEARIRQRLEEIRRIKSKPPESPSGKDTNQKETNKKEVKSHAKTNE